jgi:hypothetical protein
MGLISDALSSAGDLVEGVADSGLGSVIGFALGGPVGAAIGGGIGGLISGGDLRSGLTGAAGGYALGAMASGMGVPTMANAAPAMATAAPVGGMAGSTAAMSAAPTVGRTGIAALTAKPDAAWGVNPRNIYDSPMDHLTMSGFTTPAQQTLQNSAENYFPVTSTEYDFDNDWGGVGTASTDKPFWESNLMKLGIGGALLAGIFEDPDYEDVYSPEPAWSEVDELYGGPLAKAPASRRHTFGSRRSSLGRRA